MFSWIFELTPDGLKRDAEVTATESIAPQTARRVDRMIIVAMSLALGYFVIDKFMLAPTRVPAPAVAGTNTAATTDPAAVPEPLEASIAVLPFVDMSQAKDQEYFSDGLAEEILNLLAQIRDLKVIGRTSSFAFKGRNEDLRTIGSTLGVAYLLEGSVRKAGDDLRITAQLIQVDDGSHLWSQIYDRRLENVFAIQSEIAASIAQALKINLIDGAQAAPVAQVAASLPAYDLFLQARRLIQGRTRSGLEAARGLLEEALKLDPNYAPALAALAQTVHHLQRGNRSYGDLPREEAHAIAQPLLDKALALDPTLAEAHAVQGMIFFDQREFARAEGALTKALALNPNLSDALIWRARMMHGTGHLREQLALHQRLDVIDPLNVANLTSLGETLRDSGKYSEAQAVTARMLRAFPNSPQSFDAQAADLFDAGQFVEAQLSSVRALALGSNMAAGRNFLILYRLGDFDRMLQGSLAVRAAALIALGRTDEAMPELRRLLTLPQVDLGGFRMVLSLQVLGGRFDEALALSRERFGYLAARDASVAVVESAVFEAIAAAQRATGDKQGLAETLANWQGRLDFWREQGYGSGGFVMSQARYFALAGEQAAALNALTQAIGLGFRDSLLARDSAFAELQGDPAFQAQLTRMTELINIERAKLDMAPLP